MANLPRIKPVVAMKCFGRVIYRPCVQNAHHGLNLGLNFNNKGKMANLLSKYSDDALIRELNGRGYKCYDEEDGVPLDDVDEDTLIDKVEDYGYFVYDEEVDPDASKDMDDLTDDRLELLREQLKIARAMSGEHYTPRSGRLEKQQLRLTRK